MSEENNTFNSPTHPMTDEEEKSLIEQKRKAVFQAINNMKIADSKATPSRVMSTRYSPEQINRFMQNPLQFQKELRELSDYLYDYSAEYRIIIDYVSNLGKYSYVLDTLNILDENTDFKAYEKAKLKASAYLNKLNLPREMAKAMRVAWKHDVFYGYEHETKDSFIIQHMNPNYCRISGIDKLYGVFTYEFNFTYFDSNEEALNNYPSEFKKKYQTYKNTKENWQELNPSAAFAFKVNEEITSYPLLPYSVLFDPIFNLEESKKIHNARIKMDNFMLLVQQIPINDKSQSMDDFLISLETAMEFHNFAVAGLGDNTGIGFVTTPMEITALKTDKGGNKDRDAVAMALRSIYDAGGISQFLVNSDKNTSTGVAKSIILDEQKIYKMFRQVEGWINRKLFKMNGKFKFRAKLLDVTNFDEEDSFDAFLKGAQSGFPSIEESAASIGISYLDLHNKLTVENSPISLRDRMRPLQTSHTQSAKNSDEAGRSKVSDDEATDSTIINRDANTDEDRSNE